MTDKERKELKKLSREELLELLLLQSRAREGKEKVTQDGISREELTQSGMSQEGITPSGMSQEGFTPEELKEELHRERYRKQYRRTLRGTIYMLVTVAAVAVLIATLLVPVLRIYGDSMNPTLESGDVVVAVKSGNFNRGDMVAFYYNNKILVKRVIASAGQWVDINGEGAVFVDGQLLDEPYLTEKALGECDIEFPYQVPESRIFVMGDNRSVSVDSRSTSVGCVAEEQVVGKIFMRLWPFKIW